MKKYLTVDIIIPTLAFIFLTTLLVAGIIVYGNKLLKFEYDSLVGAIVTWICLIVVFIIGYPLITYSMIKNIKDVYKQR